MNKKSETQISLVDSIKQTGFILEHQVATMLEEKGWAVIHTRYYLDDVISQQREIDMVAYKVQIKDDFRLVTALIISCKKSDLYDWIFLTRKAPAMNYNLNLFPVTFSSNIDEFNYEVKLVNWNEELKTQSDSLPQLIRKLNQYDETIFAFKEFKTDSLKGRSDSSIFDSISSLIKAQSYEIKSLKNRRKTTEKYIYNFNLLSISDVIFKKVLFDKENITETTIDRINYINRFLINNEEQYSRIDFITFKKLKNAIDDYDSLHQLNLQFWDTLENRFYDNVWDVSRINDIIEKNGNKFLSQVKSKIYESKLINDSDFKSLEFDKKENNLIIDCYCSSKSNEYLNTKPHIQSFTKSWLKKIFRYEGSFTYEDIFPF
ncbi:hypothetical protein SAMN05421821_105195 [Mucilaginibacter lappiensis]|uniref:DUF4365 domain-containing protein n=1 Tax=Mucilaginibacter lappiensis TaxID=354630 RepID=A0ABR6PJ24_9SPHI|nr:hypothetical protein [Mucilaginibacter lappiensis]MBB6109777.1 hypothetical protein [Mucilaginibacter lappiensis]SIR15161.1 hypothetical protein SAMN05421821_105195 [Mucilaginibacter lappiensis]